MTSTDARGVGVRVQRMELLDQVLVLCRVAESRSEDGYFKPVAVIELFYASGLPVPDRISNSLGSLARRQLMIKGREHGRWRLTPAGRARSYELLSDLDLAALAAEATASSGAELGHARHALVPPDLAPPGLVGSLSEFLQRHPFDTNVFGMTRFPDDDEENRDPVADALVAAREACSAHGLEFHLASDRAMFDDLWTNVTAHMWASRYGIAFFEDRRGRGINYNLTIEVGGMLVTGRRCALLRDETISRMPTDLVGMIYKPVNLDDADAVARIVHEWIRDDLTIGTCASCPSP